MASAKMRGYAQAHSKEEVRDFLKIAAGLLVNVGTLSPEWTESMLIAGHTATKASKPWVLDPVGAGATPYRTQVCGMYCKLKLILPHDKMLLGRLCIRSY
jgi:hydroxyethylthiazole kinase-like sugar kinase family protein